jgi:hypothetical protein
MAKKTTQAPAEAPPEQPHAAVPAETMTEPSTPANGARRPLASWKYPAASGVTVEVALWPHTIRLQDGSEIEVYNATVARSYRDQNNQWQKGGSFRVAELPVLVHALQSAFGFAMNQREMNCPL